MSKILTNTPIVISPGTGQFPELNDAVDGPREAKVYVRFPEGYFADAPIKVVVSFCHIDVWNNHNTRLDVSAEDITDDGFNMVFRTWSDTQVYGCGASWIAIQN